MPGVKSRRKLVALTVAAAGIAVLLGAAVTARSRLAAEWHGYWLRYGTEEQRLAASDRLAALGTRDAAERLAVAVIEGTAISPSDPLLKALRRVGPLAIEPMARALHTKADFVAELIAHPGASLDGDVFMQHDFMEADAVFKSLLALRQETSQASTASQGLAASLTKKSFAWCSGPIQLEGAPCRALIFDAIDKGWPGWQPQVIVIVGSTAEPLVWKEVGVGPCSPPRPSSREKTGCTW